MYITDNKVNDGHKSAIFQLDQVIYSNGNGPAIMVMVQLYLAQFFRFNQIKINNGHKLAILNLIQLRFFRPYPSLKPHIWF